MGAWAVRRRSTCPWLRVLWSRLCSNLHGQGLCRDAVVASYPANPRRPPATDLRVETRLIAVDSVRGIVGSKTIHRFDRRLLSLAARCAEHLSGQIDLFPASDRKHRDDVVRVPEGEANLAFGGARVDRLVESKPAGA